MPQGGTSIYRGGSTPIRFWERLPPSFQMGVGHPSWWTLFLMGEYPYPSHPSQNWVGYPPVGTPVGIRWGTPNRDWMRVLPCQDLIGVPSHSRWGTPTLPSFEAKETEQLQIRQYASCIHGGGLSCPFNCLALLNILQLPTGSTGLYSQGATAVVHGCSLCGLGQIWVNLHRLNGRHSVSTSVYPFNIISEYPLEYFPGKNIN